MKVINGKTLIELIFDKFPGLRTQKMRYKKGELQPAAAANVISQAFPGNLDFFKDIYFNTADFGDFLGAGVTIGEEPAEEVRMASEMAPSTPVTPGSMIPIEKVITGIFEQHGTANGLGQYLKLYQDGKLGIKAQATLIEKFSQYKVVCFCVDHDFPEDISIQVNDQKSVI